MNPRGCCLHTCNMICEHIFGYFLIFWLAAKHSMLKNGPDAAAFNGPTVFRLSHRSQRPVISVVSSRHRSQRFVPWLCYLNSSSNSLENAKNHDEILSEQERRKMHFSSQDGNEARQRKGGEKEERNKEIIKTMNWKSISIIWSSRQAFFKVF